MVEYWPIANYSRFCLLLMGNNTSTVCVVGMNISTIGIYCTQYHHKALQWRHNEHDGVLNHQRLDCLFNYLFRRRSKKSSKLRVTGLCEGNSPVTGEFPAQGASNGEKCFHLMTSSWNTWATFTNKLCPAVRVDCKFHHGFTQSPKWYSIKYTHVFCFILLWLYCRYFSFY